jgi:hypothetical protein
VEVADLGLRQMKSLVCVVKNKQASLSEQKRQAPPTKGCPGRKIPPIHL